MEINSIEFKAVRIIPMMKSMPVIKTFKKTVHVYIFRRKKNMAKVAVLTMVWDILVMSQDVLSEI